MKRFLPKIQQVGEVINKYSIILLGINTVILSIIVIGQMLLRQINISFKWATEISCLLFVWQTLLGSAVASRYMLHIGVDILINSFDGVMRKILLIVSHVIMIIVLLIFTASSAKYTTANIYHLGVSFNFSIAWFYMSLPICGMLMIYHSTVQLIEIIYYGEAIRVPLIDSEVKE